MRILGIDPGFGRTGWALIEKEGGRQKSLSYGCLETSSAIAFSKRLREVFGKVGELIDQYQPEAMAIEELFFNTNAKTAFLVGQARGVIILAAAEKNLPVVSYTPLEVKMAVAGYGQANKGQVAQMVKRLLALKEIPKPDDAADALAIALTHAFSRGIRAKKML